MMSDLARMLIDAGLLQFGSFVVNGDEVPFQGSLAMLASYPDVLRAVTDAAAPLIPPADHLLATNEAVPLGVALSLHTGIPLVYSRGTDAAPVVDLVGAYDIGHPAVLVTTLLSSAAPVTRLLEGARRVGLEVHTVVPIIDAGAVQLPDREIVPVLRLAEIVADLVENGMLPEGQGWFVLAWIGGRLSNRLRQGSAAP